MISDQVYQWTDGIVAILGRNGRPVGTGFVATPEGLVVTCDHVLEEAGWPFGAWDKPVRIAFRATGEWAEAYVEPAWYRQKIEGDVAILSLRQGLPVGVKPLPMTAAALSAGHQIATLGHPAGYNEGLYGSGEVRGLLKMGGSERLQLWSEETTKGFSGGPVWDLTWHAVIGMVQSGRQADDQGRLRFTWFAIPSETLITICDRLALSEPAQKQPAPAGPAAPGLWIGVPPKPAQFMGRETLLTELTSQLTGAANVTLAAEGMPGVGKSSLAVALAHDSRILTHFRDGVLWAGLGPRADPDSALISWADALGLDLAGTAMAGRTESIRNAIGQRRMLLIIDDAWEITAAEALRCGGPNCATVLTTRDIGLARAFAGAGQTISIPVLTDEPAFALLEKLAPEACAADRAAARALAAAVGGLPLALELLGGYLAAPERSLIPRLSQAALAKMTDPAQRLQLATARLGTSGGQVTLEEGIALSLATLRETEAGAAAEQAFYALGAFAPKLETFSWDAAEAITAAEIETIALLAARNLVSAMGDELTLHQIVADVAHARVAQEVIERHREYYLALVNENRDDWQKIEMVYGQIKRAWRHAPDDRQLLLEFTEALQSYQDKRGLWNDKINWYKRVLNLARERGWRKEEGTFLTYIGWVYHNQGNPEKALLYFNDSLPIQEEVSDDSGLAYTLMGMSAVYSHRGQHNKALNCLKRALVLWQEAPDLRQAATTLSNIGVVYMYLGQMQDALEYYKQSLDVWNKLEDKSEMRVVLNNMGVAHDTLGNRQEALHCYEQAVSLAAEEGDRRLSAFTFNNIGFIYNDLGQPDAALENYERAIAIWEEMNEAPQLANTLSNIGAVHNSLGNWSEALRYLDRALPILQGAQALAVLAKTFNLIGTARSGQGRDEEALLNFQQALDYAEKANDPLQQSAGLHNKGILFLKTDRPDLALGDLQQALAIREQVGDRPGEAETRTGIALLYRAQGRLAESLAELRKVVDLDRAVGRLNLENDLALLAEVEAELAAKGR